MSRIPKKITPDRLRESIVQVFFHSEIPFEPLVGYLFSVLKNEFSFEYLNRPLPFPASNNNHSRRPNRFDINNIELSFGPKHLFYNEEIKIELQQGNALVFNCSGRYLGWTKYFGYISKILRKLSEVEIFLSYHRVGIRYISEFPNIDLLEKTNFSFGLVDKSATYNSGRFKIEWQEDVYRINFTLASKIQEPPILDHDDIDKIENISLIDIDVIIENLAEKDVDKFLYVINAAHSKEKELFFTLIKEEFLETLNPEY